LKASKFQVNHGEYAVVATYSNYNDVTDQTEETTLRTHEKPRGRFYTDLADLAFKARDFFKLGELRLTISTISFTDNDNGRSVRLQMETEGEHPIKVQPPAVSRKPFIKPGEEAPDPESQKNIFLEAVNLVENRISEYLNGDREQPELPMKPEQPSKAARKKGILGLFGPKEGEE